MISQLRGLQGARPSSLIHKPRPTVHNARPLVKITTPPIRVTRPVGKLHPHQPAYAHRPKVINRRPGCRTVRFSSLVLPLGFATHTYVGSEPIYYTSVVGSTKVAHAASSDYYSSAGSYQESSTTVPQPTYKNAPKFGYGSDLPKEVSYEIDTSSILATNEVRFHKNSIVLADDDSAYYLHSLVAAINSPELVAENFVIEGHASAEGSEDYNWELSQKRANGVYDFLVSEGVAPHRLLSVGHGENMANYTDDSPEDLRALDRRVIIAKLAK